MAEFCKCGSLIIGGRCSNKGCNLKGLEKQAPVKAVRKTATGGKTPAKCAKTRKASKCISYNLYEAKSEEGGDL
ncbi:MAG: hypothetical protein FIA99_00675 [Ruminiclostridium sp.]|nr:hypothetical protein [Ruminiclostridium sp.]